MARRAGPGPGLLLGRLLRRRGGRRGGRRARGRRGAERGGSRLAGLGLPGRDLPGGAMRVAKWLAGLLYQLSLFIARSWEVHFHPRQGKVTARRRRQRGGGSGPSGTPPGGVGGGGSERLSPLGNPGSAGAPETPGSLGLPSIPRGCRQVGFRGIVRGGQDSLRGPCGGGAWGSAPPARGGAGGEDWGRGWAAQGLACQGLCWGGGSKSGVWGSRRVTLAGRTCVCARARARHPVCICRAPGCSGDLGPWVFGWRSLGVGVGNTCGGVLNGHFTVVAEALVRTLASYEVVTPARVNEFGEVFPQSHHFSRRKRSSEAPEPTPLRTHYRISAYGQLFQLNLSADAAFLAEGFTEVHVGAPGRGAAESGAASPGLRHCFYRGQVNAREDHVAVFSLCGGLVSALRSSDVFLRSHGRLHPGSHVMGFSELVVADPRDQMGSLEGLTPQ